MGRRSYWLAAALLAACSAGTPATRVCEPQPTERALVRPGASTGLTPDGRALMPHGELLELGQGPLHLAAAPGGARIASAEFGVNLRGVSIVEAQAKKPLALAQRLGQWRYETDRGRRQGAYLRGLAFSADGRVLYAANTGTDAIDVFALGAADSFALQRSMPVQGSWPADLALSADGATIYVTLALSRAVHAYDAATGILKSQSATPGSFPHALLLDGDRLFVANQGADLGRRNRVSVHAAADLAQTGSFVVGKNPGALAVSPDRGTLYVAASDDDWIDRVDLASGAPLQPFMLAPSSVSQVSPTALAISPDGGTLFVASALRSSVIVLDARTGERRGEIPAGWRPSALLLADAGRTLYVASARGLGSGPSPDAHTDISSPQRGLLQRIAPVPAGDELQALTAKVALANARPTTEFAAPDPSCARVGPLPARRGQDPSASLIRHVIVVFKENKTFDSVFGDFPNAEASRDYLLFGDRITPNQHELARQFCLADNFLLESEQSVEGHFWMSGQNTNDYFERIWAGPWGGGVRETPLPPGGLSPLDSPRAGFIWDAFARAHVAYGSWGEFVGIGGDLGHNIDLRFVDNPTNYLARPDTEKLEVFLQVLRAGTLPSFSFVALQWDHTFGGAAGKPAPDYMVADNDLATGRLVEAVSKSPYWRDTLILITEDDPSGGADHVDRRRSFALVVSPYARRGRVSHVRGSMASMASTWERALGVQPLSQFDADAEPLWDCLTGTPDFTAFSALPSNIAARTNQIGDPGELESRGLDLSTIDKARLGPSLWRALRPNDPMPKSIAE